MSCPAGVTQFSERLSFYLSYSLSGYIKFLAHVLESARSAVVKTEAELYDVRQIGRAHV